MGENLSFFVVFLPVCLCDYTCVHIYMVTYNYSIKYTITFCTKLIKKILGLDIDILI